MSLTRVALVMLVSTACEFPVARPVAWSDCRALDKIAVEGVEQVGDDLEVDVSFGGGCEEHRFSICWPDQAFLESDPVQVDAVMWHDVDDRRGRCDAIVYRTVSFPLAALYEAYEASYGAPGEVVVNLGRQSVTVDVPGAVE